MSIAQWTVDNTGPVAESLSTVSPLEGTSSLDWVNSGGELIVRGLTSGADISTGKIRSLLKITATAGTGVHYLGLFGMMQTSILNTSNAYWAGVSWTATAGTLTSTGLISKAALNTPPPSGVLDSGALGINITVGLLFALELKWQLDPDSGQVVLTLSAGTSADFSDLASKVVTTDASSPYASGVSAGPGLYAPGGSTVTVKVDKTQIFRV